MKNPISLYRLQFNKSFTFRDFKTQLEYFKTLGVGAIYANPIFKASPGSLHGYDVVNPLEFNASITSYYEFKNLVNELKDHDIGWIQDFVPNHMAFYHQNKWLWDLQEKGEKSRYSGFFDIDYNHPVLGKKLMAPFLGNSLGECINNQEIKAKWLNGSFIITYYEQQYPVSFDTVKFLFNHYTRAKPGSLLKVMNENAWDEASETASFLNNRWENIKPVFDSLYAKDESFQSYINYIIDEINNDDEILLEILENQHYKLTLWRKTGEHINYRRFFTISELICLAMDKKEVFEEYHKFLHELIRDNLIDGIRIDHIDGLMNPVEYISRLRTLAGKEKYIVAEKILEQGENLPLEFELQGTTGYDFLTLVNNLFTCQENMRDLHSFYHQLTGNDKNTRQVILQKKKFILKTRMSAEWDNLTRMFTQSSFANVKPITSVPGEKIKEAIGEFLCGCPIYRLYSNTLPLSANDKKLVIQVLKDACKRYPAITPALKALEQVFTTQQGFNKTQQEEALRFFSRCMQFTGPLTAKGLEDTAMYTYNAFIAHNEVGDSPGAEGISKNEFHQSMQLRSKNWPLTMNTTSTHDTKRGEDVRARLNVISEMPGEWTKKVEEWRKINKKLKIKEKNIEIPSVNEEFFLYQTLVGFIPHDGVIDDSIIKRFKEYVVKALREAKTNTSWINTNPMYEKHVLEFVDKLLSPRHEFRDSLTSFVGKIADHGMINSLSQLLLKHTCPGVPDTYQGSELWDLSLVDPDNRREVDFVSRFSILKNLLEKNAKEPGKQIENLLKNRNNGEIKLWLTHQLLKLGKEMSLLFSKGEYIPLETKGKYKEHILGFARKYQDLWTVTVVPLFSYKLNKYKPFQNFNWEDTRIQLPFPSPSNWKNIIENTEITCKNEIYMNDVSGQLPLCLLKGEFEQTKRGAGVLLHISSLPGKYGTGDFGKQAFEFIDFLKASGFKYWQILPLTATTKEAGWSPYSSPSAFAGNKLFISPKWLKDKGLIDDKHLQNDKTLKKDKAHFDYAEKLRDKILNRAFKNFLKNGDNSLQKAFEDFCNNEKYWLEDYTLFEVLKTQYANKPWNQWPKEVRERYGSTLDAYREKFKNEIIKEKFIQFIFLEQWKELKAYANRSGIKIIGDIPIYVSFDNADVWANTKLFKLTDDKKMKFIAGVPPDYFSKTGQKWDMPVYDWEEHLKSNYDWWIRRIKKNLELYDLLRIDHFRGFSAYWEIPGNDKTAVNGKWAKAPGEGLLRFLEKEFPTMPFIAEDLGDIDQPVYDLRDQYNLPGMQVLQFAFGDDMPKSIHIPHNHIENSIAYTGTHDNNTTKGWFKEEVNKPMKKRMKKYFDKKVKTKNCNHKMIRATLASCAKIAIIPMQDLLDLDSWARMNNPGGSKNNWVWKVRKKDLNKKFIKNTRKLLLLFNRI